MALRDNVLKYTKRQIDDAGKIIVNQNSASSDLQKAMETLNNFRSCHAYPINTFQATLRTKVNKLALDSLVSQRLKRTPSILLKLQRYPKMRLSQMQDIGGLRCILATNEDVQRLVDEYESTSFQHELKSKKDYIGVPKDSGYRCYHLVYKYKNKINPAYDGLMIELQIRTKLQHAWATAVETMGIFLNHSLKSSQGPDEWLEFFSLTGNAFAIIERTPLMDKYRDLSPRDVLGKVRKEARRLNVQNQLMGFAGIISSTDFDKKQGSLHLIVLDLNERQVRVRTFPKSDIKIASEEYAVEEAKTIDNNNRHVVLVSSSSIDGLKRAYPSYFLDTQEFINTLNLI